MRDNQRESALARGQGDLGSDSSLVSCKDPGSHLSSFICQMGMRTAPALPPPTGRKGSGDLVGGTGLNDGARGEQHFMAPSASVSSPVTAGQGQMTSKNSFSSAQAFAMLMIKQGRLPGGVGLKDGEEWSFSQICWSQGS